MRKLINQLNDIKKFVRDKISSLAYYLEILIV